MRIKNCYPFFFAPATLPPTAPPGFHPCLENRGIDLIEIGIPFSDPMADGEVIQHAATQALRNGMSLKRLFGQLSDIRKTVEILLILMGYLNPVLRFGFEKLLPEMRRMRHRRMHHPRPAVPGVSAALTAASPNATASK